MAHKSIQKIVFASMLIVVFLAAFTETKAQSSVANEAIRGYLNESLSTSSSFQVNGNIGILHSKITFYDPNAVDPSPPPPPPSSGGGGSGSAPIYEPARQQAIEEAKNIGNEDLYVFPQNDKKIYRNSAQRDSNDLPLYTSAIKDETDVPLKPNLDVVPPETPPKKPISPEQKETTPLEENEGYDASPTSEAAAAQEKPEDTTQTQGPDQEENASEVKECLDTKDRVVIQRFSHEFQYMHFITLLLLFATLILWLLLVLLLYAFFLRKKIKKLKEALLLLEKHLKRTSKK